MRRNLIPILMDRKGEWKIRRGHVSLQGNAMSITTQDDDFVATPPL